MLAVAGTIFGLFLLCSLYLQNVLGWGPLATGLAFVPLALSAGIGSHAAGHVISKHGVRGPLAGAFAVAAVGMFLLSRVGEHGSYLADVLPGMLIAGVALGVATVSVSMAILTGTRQEESGMISGLNSTGHEIGGTLGIAIFSTIAAGSSGAILGPQAASGNRRCVPDRRSVASLASLVALAVLPRAQHFLAKLAAQPAVNAGPLNDGEDEDQGRGVRPETPPGGRRAQHLRDHQRRPRSAGQRSGCSMAAIARRAGVVRATIYMHFPTREALLDAVMEHATGAGRGGDPERRARSWRAEGSARARDPRAPGGSSASSTTSCRSTSTGSPPRNSAVDTSR